MAKGSKYQDVKTAFQNAGFVNIKLHIEYDIITGWLVKDGEVKSITINKEKKFSSGQEYKPTDKVVITYHTWRKNKPKKK